MAPRRMVTFHWVTADGHFAGADGNLDWVVPDAEQAKAAAESISGFDTVVFGRPTYDLFESFWRHAVVDEYGAIPNPHHPGRSPEQGAIAIALTGKDLVIFGSGSIVSELTRHDLIDAYQFAVCPVLLGSGQSLVRGVRHRVPLDLLEAKRLPSGDVILRYAPSTRVSP